MRQSLIICVLILIQIINAQDVNITLIDSDSLLLYDQYSNIYFQTNTNSSILQVKCNKINQSLNGTLVAYVNTRFQNNTKCDQLNVQDLFYCQSISFNIDINRDFSNIVNLFIECRILETQSIDFKSIKLSRLCKLTSYTAFWKTFKRKYFKRYSSS